MTRLEIAFRVAVVALLAVIALQLGAGDSVADAARQAYRSVASIGAKEERPAPPPPGRAPGGLLDAYGLDSTLPAASAAR